MASIPGPAIHAYWGAHAAALLIHYIVDLATRVMLSSSAGCCWADSAWMLARLQIWRPHSCRSRPPAAGRVLPTRPQFRPMIVWLLPARCRSINGSKVFWPGPRMFPSTSAAQWWVVRRLRIYIAGCPRRPSPAN